NVRRFIHRRSRPGYCTVPFHANEFNAIEIQRSTPDDSPSPDELLLVGRPEGDLDFVPNPEVGCRKDIHAARAEVDRHPVDSRFPYTHVNWDGDPLAVGPAGVPCREGKHTSTVSARRYGSKMTEGHATFTHPDDPPNPGRLGHHQPRLVMP